MKFHPSFALAALALGSAFGSTSSFAAASPAATVTAWGTLGPVADVAYVTYHNHTPQAIDDVYTFDIGGKSDVDAYGEEFEARSVSMPGATFELFSGTYGSATATAVGTPFTFNNTATETMYTALASGHYYFEVKGTSLKAGSAYDFEAYGNPSTGPSAVPEPENAALLLAGLGMMGFIAARRAKRA
jgi:hypothetical protein